MAIAITQTANPAGVTAVANIATYSSVALGAASPDRVIVVVFGKEVATVQPIGIEAAGMTFIYLDGNAFGSMAAFIFYAAAPSGTAVDIVITFDGAITNVQNHIAVYSVTGAVGVPTSSGNNTSTDMDATARLTTGSTTIPVGGGMLAVAVGATDTVAKTWANLTEDIDADVGGFRFTTATSLTAGTATRTCTGATNGEDGVLAWAIFDGIVYLPTLLMPPYRAPYRQQ